MQSKTPRLDNPFRVLGIAMIVDQRGVGARMVARYPTEQSPVPPNLQGEDNHHCRGSEDQSTDDLFFSLTASQMAKLFRAKKSLCGQPMTLTVNGTVFCWRAVLMVADEDGDESTTESSNQLILFSVIVALSSPVSHTSAPFAWNEGPSEDQLDLHEFLKAATAAESKRQSSGDIREAVRSTSSASLSIRRVHISLARLCRVLEREEKRCHYVSDQANVLLRIRSEQQKKWELQKVASAASTTQQGSNNPTSSSSSVISSSTAQTGRPRRTRHSRQQSLGDDSLLQSKITPTVKEEQGREQDILELMLAAFHHGSNSAKSDPYEHHGNLVRELVQVFHSLSRNDYEYPPTAAALLCERDGVVHVNSHIVVPIEAASVRTSHGSAAGPSLRPYFTLLFPHASPSALLRTFQSSGSAAPQRLQQLLKTVNPQKSLSEIAVNANLPLYTTMEIASYLVAHGACVPSPIVSRKSRLNCLHVEKIPQLALEFSQTFANVNFFRLLGFLTSTNTLGEAMAQMTDLNDDRATWLRECWPPFKSIRENLSNMMTYTPDNQARQSPVGPNQNQPKRPRHRWVEELEEFLYAMTVWLLSHRVLTLTQEYVVLNGFGYVGGEPSPTPPRTPNETDEHFFQELNKFDFLSGDISIMALSWRLGLDQKKVRSWGYRHPKVRVVSRIPAPGDDWEMELS